MKTVFAFFMENLIAKTWSKYLYQKLQTIEIVFCPDSIATFTIFKLYNSVVSTCKFFCFLINTLEHVLFSKKMFGKTRKS